MAPLPTDAELRILRVLWDLGPSSVHEVHEALAGSKIGYTTVLKTLQVMHDKQLVDRKQLARYTKAHAYSARMTREQIERGLVGDFTERTFDGSVARLVQQALSSTETGPDEIARIRALLDQIEKERS